MRSAAAAAVELTIAGVDDRDPRVAVARDDAQRLLARRRDRERNARNLHRGGPDNGFVHRVVGALVRDGRFGEQAAEERDELLEPGDELAARQRFFAEHGRVEADATRADAEDEATAGDVIERHRVLGERDRVPHVR